MKNMNNDLANRCPDLAAEWHPVKNEDLKPENVTCGSGKKVWWLCPVCKGEYEATVYNRTSGTGCPYCANQKVLAGFNDLDTKNPQLSAEWHPTKNGDLTPKGVVASSNKKVWWLCPVCKGEYEAAVSSRDRGTGCPYCAGNRVKVGYNDLETKNPELAAEWHPLKNGTLTPREVTSGSNKKVWWLCPACKGEYEAAVSNRNNGTGCPYCAGNRLRPDYNDLATKYPNLVAEWHPTKNGDLTPADVTCGTHRKVWWVCKEGHEWEASVAKRSSGGRGCPYCANKMVLSGYNDMASRYPDIAAEWHPTKNGDLTPLTVTWGSNKKVWWLCPKCGYEYQAVINKRTSSGEGCPCCGPIAKKIMVGFNDLGTTHPNLAREWHPSMNGKLRPKDVTFGSNKRVWWVCPECNSDYDAVIAARAQGGGCPYCAGKRVKTGFNDLATRFPSVAAEWHPTKNGFTTPADILPHSERKYWWKCSRCGNEWRATPDSRINRLSCPECSFYTHTSFPEQAILYYTKQAFPDAEGRNKDLGFELDIYIPSIKVAIEYDGVYYHHGNRVAGIPDDEKDKLCVDNGIKLYRIRENGLNPTTSSIPIMRENLSNEDLDRCINILFKYLGIDFSASVDKDQTKILAQYNTFLHDNSLQVANPQLAAEWHPTRNGGLSPENIPAGSGKKAWWLCPVCHGEWQTRIVERNQGRGCPYCANQKLLKGYNDLLSKSPSVALDWHPTLNGELKPTDIVSTTNKKVWWRCHVCGYEWSSQVSSRVTGGTGCRKCSNEKRINTSRKNKIDNGAPTFEEKYPELAAEWHPTKNGTLKPSDITFGAGYKAWWQCSICGKEWQQTTNNRVRYKAVGCAECRRKLTSEKQEKDSKAFEEELRRVLPSVELVSEYVNSHTKVKCRCKTCLHEWSVLPYSLLRQKYGCPNCAKKGQGVTRRKSPDQFIKELSQINPNILPIEEYTTSHAKIKCRCLTCGNEWLIAPSKLLSGRGCPKCARKHTSERQKKTTEKFVEEMKSINTDIMIRGDYINTHTKIKCKCKKCGLEWLGLPSNLLRGTGCPSCNKKDK